MDNIKTKTAFICTHNSCRSQIAEALGNYYNNGNFQFFSAGTHIKKRINPDATRLLKKLYNIDMEKTQYPKLLETLPQVDIVVTMGCGIRCPYLSCKYRKNWELADPTGKSDEEFIKIISEIDRRIKLLIFP